MLTGGVKSFLAPILGLLPTAEYSSSVEFWARSTPLKRRGLPTVYCFLVLRDAEDQSHHGTCCPRFLALRLTTRFNSRNHIFPLIGSLTCTDCMILSYCPSALLGIKLYIHSSCTAVAVHQSMAYKESMPTLLGHASSCKTHTHTHTHLFLSSSVTKNFPFVCRFFIRRYRSVIEIQSCPPKATLPRSIPSILSYYPLKKSSIVFRPMMRQALVPTRLKKHRKLMDRMS